MVINFKLFFSAYTLPQSFNTILRVFKNIGILLKFAVTFTNEQVCTVSYKSALIVQEMRLNHTKVCYHHFTISEPGIKNQGSDQLYQGLGKIIHKGHLNPVRINSYDAKKVADTFTYANAVPQYAKFNNGKWKKFENIVVQYAQTDCAPLDGDMYVLTGTSQFTITQPKANHLKDYLRKIEHLQDSQIESEIEIPNSMWTAVCCVFPDGMVYTFAGIGNNVKNKAKIYMQIISLKDLEKFLSTYYFPVDLFPGKNNLCRKKGGERIRYPVQ